MSNEISLLSEIIKTPTDILFTLKNSNKILSVVSCNINNGIIESITTENGDIYTKDLINIYNNTLFIPGIGSIKPGTYVYYQGVKYLLLFGWHTNISNQTIYSWYLRDVSETPVPDKTLYEWMIDKIDILEFISEVLYHE